MQEILRLDRDLTGDEYSELIRAAVERFSLFSLVWRDQLEFDASAAEVRRDLEGSLARLRRGSRWPGTRLFGSKAEIAYYRCEPSARGVLLRPGSLFGWLAPSFPEDLAFYDESGNCRLASVAHEELGWLLDVDFGRAALPSDSWSEEPWQGRVYEFAPAWISERRSRTQPRVRRYATRASVASRATVETTRRML